MIISRRKFSAGLSALVGGIVTGMRFPRAGAAAGAPIKNLIVFTTGDGTSPEAWNYQSILTPLAAHKADSLVLRGVKFADESRNYNHNGSEVALRGNGAGMFGGATIDHYIARAKKCAAADGNAFGLLIPMTQDDHGTAQSRVSYVSQSKLAEFPDTPLKGFRKFFPDIAPVSPEGNTFLDLQLTEYKEIQKSLGASERAKVDGCIESLHKIQQQQSGGGPKLSCAKPAAPSTIDTINVNQFEDVMDACIELAVMALKCNLTQVVTLQVAEDQNMVSAFAKVKGINSLEAQHNAAHANSALYVSQQRWYMSKVAKLIEALKRDALFADTLVFRGFDFGRGDHQGGNPATFVPYVLCSGSSSLANRGKELTIASANSHEALLAAVCALTGAPVPAGKAVLTEVAL